MTEQEKINAEIQMKLAMQDAKFAIFVQEMRDFKTEMRQQNQMRAEEIREIRQDMKAMQANLDAKIDSMGKHVRNLSVAAMAAVGGMFVAVGVMVGTMIYTILTR